MPPSRLAVLGQQLAAFTTRMLHWARLRLPEPTIRFVRFGLIGLSGLIVNESLLALIAGRLGVYYLAAAGVSTQVSILWNFALTERWVYARRSCRLDRKARLGTFCVVATTAQLATIPVLYVLVDHAAVPYLLANLITIGLATLVRFTLAERVIWKRAPSAHPNGPV